MLRAGVQPERFTRLKTVVEFICGYYEKQLEIPGVDVLNAQFPDYAWNRKDDFPYWLKRFIDQDAYRKAAASLEKHIPRLKDDPVGAIQGLRMDLSDIGVTVDEGHASKTDAGAIERLGDYRARALNRRRALMVKGIPTGLLSIDATGVGWQDGELVGVVSATGIGKTWLLCYFGVTAWRGGSRVLFVSPEMAARDLELRVDTLLAGQSGMEISNLALQQGHPIDEEAYKKLLSRMAKREDWLTVDHVEDINLDFNAVRKLVREHKPDLVLIDGLGFMISGGAGDKVWEQVRDISYSLKSMAEAYNLVIILSDQATRDVRPDRIPKINQCAFGQGFAHACDKVIGLARRLNEESQLIYRMEKNRRGMAITDSKTLAWEVDKGIIREIG